MHINEVGEVGGKCMRVYEHLEISEFGVWVKGKKKTQKV
jgi:hypothetical protein